MTAIPNIDVTILHGLLEAEQSAVEDDDYTDVSLKGQEMRYLLALIENDQKERFNRKHREIPVNHKGIQRSL